MNHAESAAGQSLDHSRRQRSRWQLALITGVVVTFVYFVIAYLLLPIGWKRYEKKHPWLNEVIGVTETRDGIPGDPVNVAMVGTEEELRDVLQLASWDAADALSLRSDVKIAADTVLRKSYEDAPVSSLYLFGRKEDLAYEKPVGDDPRRRHHVRFWRGKRPFEDGRPVWFGAATYDERVGFSHTTGEVTHHIAPDVDVERTHFMSSLQQTGKLEKNYFIDNFHVERTGRNGGGDVWSTDGRLAVGVINGDVP